MAKKSEWEEWADGVMRAAGLPTPIREYQFISNRKWRFDFAWPPWMIAVEIQGGTFSRGRHNRGPAMHNEYEKFNAAQTAGWRLYLFDIKHLESCEFIEVLKAAFDASVTSESPPRSRVSKTPKSG